MSRHRADQYLEFLLSPGVQRPRRDLSAFPEVFQTQVDSADEDPQAAPDGGAENLDREPTEILVLTWPFLFDSEGLFSHVSPSPHHMRHARRLNTHLPDGGHRSNVHTPSLKAANAGKRVSKAVSPCSCRCRRVAGPIIGDSPPCK